MDWDKLDLSPRITSALTRAKIGSIRDLMCVSALDLLSLTGLSVMDVQQLLAAAAAACRHRPLVPVLSLCRGDPQGPGPRLSLGCPVLDQLLRGGLPAGGVTELAGESGAGKTQLALQLCLSVQYPPEHGGLQSGAVYICTEDCFPIRRLQQLVSAQSSLRPEVPPDLIGRLQFSDRLYVEHVADLDSLHVCLNRRVPLLLARGLVRLLVIDSVAALFRCEFQADDWLERSRQLLTFASTLHHLSQEFSAPVLCINQVSDVVDAAAASALGPQSCTVAPALGLAWANQVTVRLMMRRLPRMVTRGDQCSALRRLDVVFAPHLARDGRDAAVWKEGVRGVATSDCRSN
ncbi:uncharacterized protein V6R79_004104 [Siganus canaliculatus]